MPALFLTCVSAPFFRFELTDSPAYLGRSSECQFVVNDPTISRKHAELRLEKDALVVTDLQSRNGTFVDAQRIGVCSLTKGQHIRFGGVAFALSEEGAEEESSEATDPAKRPSNVTVMMQEALSEAQRRVFQLLLTESAEKEIAKHLGISSHTVHNHVKAIFKRLGVHSRTQLLANCLRSPGQGTSVTHSSKPRGPTT